MKLAIRTCRASSQAVKKHRAHVRWAAVAIGLLVLGAIVAAFMIVSRRPTTSLTAIPEKSIAVLPFVNMSDGQGRTSTSPTASRRNC